MARKNRNTGAYVIEPTGRKLLEKPATTLLHAIRWLQITGRLVLQISICGDKPRWHLADEQYRQPSHCITPNSNRWGPV